MTDVFICDGYSSSALLTPLMIFCMYVAKLSHFLQVDKLVSLYITPQR